MPWVKFVRDYDHYWKSGARTAYKKGMVLLVKEEVAEAAGDKAEPSDKPTDHDETGHPKAKETPSMAKRVRGKTTPPAYDGEPDAASEGND